MTAEPALLRRIEELRRQLHEGMAAPYEPARLQALAPISEELDRLVVQVTRQELNGKQGPTGD